MATQNKEIEVFISYAWGEDSPLGKERMQFIADLQDAFKRKGVKVLIDKEEISYKKSIQSFMNKLSSGKYIIMVISEKYLKSKNCMYEAMKILEDDNFYDRIFPVVFKDAKIYDPIEILEYIQFWTDKINELNEKIKKVDALVYGKAIINELEQYFDIRRLLTKFTDVISDLNTLTPEKIRENDFERIFNSINSTASATVPSEIKYCIDIAFCIDTKMNATNLELIRHSWLKENIQLLRNTLNAKSKTVDIIRCKLVEINDPNGINTRFYDFEKESDLSLFYKKQGVLKVSDVPIKDLSLIRKTIQSDWINISDRARHIIIIFSENPIPESEFTDGDETFHVWEENEHMSRFEKRLVIYAPDANPWSTIANTWENAILYPTDSINEQVLLDHKSTEEIINLIVRSV